MAANIQIYLRFNKLLNFFNKILNLVKTKKILFLRREKRI